MTPRYEKVEQESLTSVSANCSEKLLADFFSDSAVACSATNITQYGAIGMSGVAQPKELDKCQVFICDALEDLPEKGADKSTLDDWSNGLRAFAKDDWAQAEEFLRKAHKRHPILDDKNDFIGNQIAVDLAQSILNNPTSKPDTQGEAIGLLWKASKFYANHHEELCSEVVFD